jgi:hypothetical protein
MNGVWSVQSRQGLQRVTNAVTALTLGPVTVFPDHLEVEISGTPPLNVLYGEVGLKVPKIVGVEGAT